MKRPEVYYLHSNFVIILMIHVHLLITILYVCAKDNVIICDIDIEKITSNFNNTKWASEHFKYNILDNKSIDELINDQ